MTISRDSIADQVIVLDGADLANADYFNCELTYAGGKPPRIRDCTFSNCRFVFEDQAENTLRFLRWLAEGDPSSRKLLEDMVGMAA